MTESPVSSVTIEQNRNINIARRFHSSDQNHLRSIHGGDVSISIEVTIVLVETQFGLSLFSVLDGVMNKEVFNPMDHTMFLSIDDPLLLDFISPAFSSNNPGAYVENLKKRMDNQLNISGYISTKNMTNSFMKANIDCVLWKNVPTNDVISKALLQNVVRDLKNQGYNVLSAKLIFSENSTFKESFTWTKPEFEIPSKGESE